MNENTGGRVRRVVFASLVCLLVFAGAVTPVFADKGEKGTTKTEEETAAVETPLRWMVWLDQEVYPLINKDQRRAFLSLQTEAQRRAFADRLWILWGRQSGFGASFRGMYQERLELARLEFGNTVDDRARVLLIHGPPASRHSARCPAIFRPMDFWVWPYIEGLGENVVVLFYQRDLIDTWRMWNTYEGRGVLINTFSVESQGPPGQMIPGTLSDPAYRCPNGDVTMRLLAAASAWSMDPRFLGAMYSFRPFDRDRGPESTSQRFMDFSALLDKDAEPLGFEISDETRAAYGGLVEVGFAIDVNVEGLGTTPVGDVDVVQLDVVGEITSGGDVMVDRFRYLFSVPHAGDSVGLMLDRMIRPGSYLLRLKVEDVHSNHAAVEEFRFEVDRSLAAVEADDELEDFIDEYGAGMVLAHGDAAVDEEPEEEEQPLLRLVGPEGDAVSGLCRFEAIARDEVARVMFLLDDEQILTKNRPPFNIDLDLGPLPKLTTVTVVGYDATGAEIARDGYTLNVGRERFFVSLLPVSPSGGNDGRVRIGAELNIPSDGELERLELYWNEDLLATLYEPPFEARVLLSSSEQFGYVRALATLTDGSQAEDLEFVNSPEFGTVVKVTAVELPVTVLDVSGNPVEDLELEDFTVYEDKVEQTISHFSLHRDLPVRMGIVIDTSGSMEETLPTVQRVVMGFLRDLLRPRDRAFIEVFSDRPDMLTGFTADFTTIENALLALFPDRATAFYDAVVMGLFQFSGVTGRRAMVVLTDGQDTQSKNSFDDALGYAQRMGVTIYMIGVDIGATKIRIRWQISKLAEATGGKAFFVSGNSELDRIYSDINRELRTQYLLAYTSNSEKPADEIRKIKVEVDRKKVRVRTIAGYYPIGG